MTLGADDSQDAVDNWARKLDRIENSATSMTVKILRSSLNNMLGDLKKSYQAYQQSTKQGGAAGARQQAQRMADVIAVSEKLLQPKELNQWERRLEPFLADAEDLGQDLTNKLEEVERQHIRQGVREQIRAAAASAGTWLDYETEQQRQTVRGLVAEGVARGWGPKRLGRELIRSMSSLYGKAELVARTEMAAAYLEGQRRMSKRHGSNYIRWVATEDERTCPFCASRSGLIFRLDEVTMPSHPLCRCSMVPVSDKLVEAKDAELLDEKSWGEHREQVAAEFLENKARKFPNGNWTIDRVMSEFDKYRVKPTGFEKRRNPNIKDDQSARPFNVLGKDADPGIKWHR